MKFRETKLRGLVLIEPRVFEDRRGFFLESFQADKYAEAGIRGPFVQDNHSLSVKGTLRGLHAQARHPQGKLLRVIEGEIFDVAVDARKSSPTLGQWEAVELSAKNFRQIFVPPGFLHGFCVLSERAQVEYKCTEYYRPDDEVGVVWNDPDIGIEWPVESPVLSEKDAGFRQFKDVIQQLSDYPYP